MPRVQGPPGSMVCAFSVLYVDMFVNVRCVLCVYVWGIVCVCVCVC